MFSSFERFLRLKIDYGQMGHEWKEVKDMDKWMKHLEKLKKSLKDAAGLVDQARIPNMNVSDFVSIPKTMPATWWFYLIADR